jgi:spore maturation protein SpmB
MAAAKRKNAIDLFIEGARNGWVIGTTSMLPNVLMAFVLIQILNITGLMKMIGDVAAPIMLLWGLPGEGLVVLLGAFMSMGGGVGVAAGLAASGALNPVHLTILAPAIILMGAIVQYIGRCLGTADANPKWWGWQVLICIINALVAMWAMRLIVTFFPDTPYGA